MHEKKSEQHVDTKYTMSYCKITVRYNFTLNINKH